MNLNLNPNSWHAKLWRFTTEEELPNNMCSYFWGHVWGLIKLAWALFCLFLVLALFFVWLPLKCGGWESGPDGTGVSLWMWCVGAFRLYGSLALVLGSTYLWGKITKGNVSKLIKAKTEGYCPGIDWEEKDG